MLITGTLSFLKVFSKVFCLKVIKTWDYVIKNELPKQWNIGIVQIVPLLYLQCFQKAFLLGFLKVGLLW